MDVNFNDVYTAIAIIRTVQEVDSIFDEDGPHRWAKQNSVIEYLSTLTIEEQL